MTVHPLASEEGPTLRPVQDRPDSTSAYDSTWTEEPPPQSREGLERVMLTEGKIYVVLAVVLIIWAGLVVLLFRTDRKIDRLERRLEDSSSDEETR